MKRIFALLIALYCLCPSTQADTRTAAAKDSLLRIYLASPADTTRLEALYQIALLDQLSPTFIYYENKLLEEAAAQKNVLYESAATYAHIIYYYNRLDQKHTEQWMQRLEQFSEAHNYYHHYFRGKKMIVELLIFQQKIEIAIQLSQDMYDKARKLNDRDGMREACLCLLTGYFNTMRYEEGITYLNKAFELVDSKSSLNTRIDLLTKAVLAYAHLRDNETMFRHLEELNEAKNRLLAENPAIALTNGYNNLYLFIELHYALYHIRLRHPAEAWKYLEESDKHLSDSSFLPYRLIRLATYAEYYQLTEEYDKALAYTEDAIDLITPVSPNDAITYGLQKADILVKMERPKEALSVYRQTAKAKDSLSIAFSTSQMEQIQELSDIDKLLLQKEQRRGTFQRICLALSIIFIITLLLYNAYTYRNRKRLQRDEKEMRRLTATAEEANEVKSRFLSNMSYNIRIPLNNVVGFSQLLSTDNELSEEERKEYSGIIQTNSNELIQLVNDVLDLSRLEANMMKYQLQDCSVEEWCNEVGCLAPMRSEGCIRLDLQATEIREARINTDVTRLTQMVMSMLLYPDDCKEPRTIRMAVTHQPDKHLIACRIENSPMADSRFNSQKMAVRQKICQLFFEHFNGSFRMGQAREGEMAAIEFTYPTLP